MDDVEALLKAVELNPEEDVPKMMLADCLAENGRAEESASVMRVLEQNRHVELTAEQNRVAEALVEGVERTPVQTLGGYAGTGKTTVAAELFRRLPGWAVVAFTGKAADMLRRKGMRQSSTIHSAIYDTEEQGGVLIHTLKAHVAVDGFLLDEASMVSREMYDDLRSFRLPIIAIGDHGQLPPVGDDAGLMHEPMYKLETVHRNAGPIAHFAEHLRKGNRAGDWNCGGGVWVGPKTRVPERTLANANQVICAFNKTRVALNRHIRTLKGIVTPDVLFQKKDCGPVVGDRVMCLKNARLLRVFNGQQGRVGSVSQKGERMLFQPDFGGPLAEVFVEPHPEAWHAEKPPKTLGHNSDKRIPFDFAYCITAHKAQGDEFERVVVFEERCDMWEHARWAYTAASRAKNALVWAI